jgi:hypothetical protein
MPRVRVSVDDHSLLTAALEGLQLQKQRIEDQIRHVRARLGKGTARRGRPASTNSAGKVIGRKLSVAARKRIAAAQKRRWAEYRKASAAKG